MPVIGECEGQVFREAAEWFRQYYMSEFYRHLNDNLPSGVTRVGQLAELHSSVYDVIEQCKFGERKTEDVERRSRLADELIPCLKRILIAKRRHEANGADIQKQKTHNPNVIEAIEKETRKLDNLLQLPWLKNVVPMKMPQVGEFLSIESIEIGHLQTNQLCDREFDEKFHILQSPKLLLEDLRYYRGVCELRGVPVIVAYLDIDDFKILNTAYGEIEVDRRVLPKFMRTVEAHVFQHGFAYRYGGDEYMIVLPNFSKPLASSFLESLRVAISLIRYPEINEVTTVSMGFCGVDSDCALTDRELEKKANTAKSFAKAKGKNCIATYASENFEEESLYIVGEKS